MCLPQQKGGTEAVGRKSESMWAGGKVKGLRWARMLSSLGALSSLANVLFFVQYDRQPVERDAGYLQVRILVLIRRSARFHDDLRLPEPPTVSQGRITCVREGGACTFGGEN